METEETYHGRDLESMASARRYYDWMLSEFEPYIGSRVLEVGAGSGTLTEKLLRYRPEEVVSLEPSTNMYPLLERRYEGHGVVKTHRDYLSDRASALSGKMDTVVYVNVLEHVPDDHAEMRMAVDCLEPGGHVLIFVPALPWLFGTADELFGHYRRYTKETLGSVFEGLGVDLLHCRYFDVMGVLPWWVSFVLLRRPLLSHAMVGTYDALVVPWEKKLEALVEPAIGKNLLFIARKRS